MHELTGVAAVSTHRKSTIEPEREFAVLNCGELVTLAGPQRARIRSEMRELSVIADGAMLVRGGHIRAVGHRAEIERQLSPETEIVDAQGKVVLPGFVDAHTHPVFAGKRVDEFERRAEGLSYQEIAARGGGIRSTVRTTRASSEEELYQAACRYRAWFLRCGTTTVEAKSGYGLSVEDETKLLRVIRRLDREGPLRYVPTFLGAHEIPEEHRANPRTYVDLILHEMLPEIAERRLAEYCDVFCDPGIFDLATSREILQAARRAGLGLRVHADQLSRSGGAELAARIGAVTADHLERIDSAGIAALVQANVQPVLLPASVYGLGSGGFPPAREMIEAGLAVVLATDFNPGSSPSPSIPFVLSLALTHMRMPVAEGITAATINAAYSLGRGESLGSLECGKRADFVIHDCRDYREIAYFTGVESASSVYLDGQLAFDRAPTTECRSGSRAIAG